MFFRGSARAGATVAAGKSGREGEAGVEVFHVGITPGWNDATLVSGARRRISANNCPCDFARQDMPTRDDRHSCILRTLT